MLQLKSTKIMNYFKYKSMFNIHGFVDLISTNPLVDFTAPHEGQIPVLSAYEERVEPSDEARSLGLEFEYKYRVFTIACGRRWGKSYICSVIGSQEFLIPGAKIMVASYELPNARHIFENIHGILKGLGVKFTAERIQEMELIGENGSSLRVASNENVMSRLGGAISLLLIDEAKLFTPDLYEKILRPMGFDYSPYSRTILISSPEPNNWLERYYNRGQSDDPRWAKYWSTSSSTWCNPTIPREELEEMKRTMPPALYACEVMGEFTSAEGLVFGEFDQKTCVFTEEDVEAWDCLLHEGNVIINSIDPGFAHPFASVWILYVEAHETFYVFGEYHRAKTVTAVHAEAIKEFEEFNNLDVYMRFGDPASAQTLADFREHDLSYNKAQKDTTESVNSVNTLFFQESPVTGRPKLLVHHECYELIRQLVSCSWKKGRDDIVASEKAAGTKPWCKDKEFKTDWDLLDALRYGIYSFCKNNRISLSSFEAEIEDEDNPEDNEFTRAGWVKL